MVGVLVGSAFAASCVSGIVCVRVAHDRLLPIDASAGIALVVIGAAIVLATCATASTMAARAAARRICAMHRADGAPQPPLVAPRGFASRLRQFMELFGPSPPSATSTHSTMAFFVVDRPLERSGSKPPGAIRRILERIQRLLRAAS
jgi:hypothetical protein